ncbi:uncharacterized protein LOC111401485 [Olea europaea var. sylvestris]|uniref:uncharacterized protein LOC111401485 n=1 Tax=Olea europaea var. sylvestris TaxID=158386 RepID=UPI000C1D1CAB|nr:uncharacterized protein LOC111401485 [Olea europaea var. sylvestris]
MKARLVVFPIKGRNWCFSRSIDSATVASQSSNTPSTFKDLWKTIFSSPYKRNNASEDSKVELLVDFSANKMNRAWTNLEKAPQGTLKNKIHWMGLKLLSRVKPTEILFKSIPKELKCVEITYPSSLNPRLIRRRLRHIAFRGSVVHTQYFYGSAILLPLTSVFMFLPLPNVPFFWILFRSYSHWRAAKGSEKLLRLVTDDSTCPNQHLETKTRERTASNSDEGSDDSAGPPWVFDPSKELDEIIDHDDANGLSKCSIKKICEKFNLNTMDVIKYQDSM